MKNKFLNTTYSEFISENHTDYIIAYHGSDYIFDKFEKKKNKDKEGFDPFGEGIYFVDNISEAKEYGKYVYKCKLYLNKIFDIDNNLKDWITISEKDNFTNILINMGYDGVSLTKSFYKIYVVFDTKDIKIMEFI